MTDTEPDLLTPLTRELVQVAKQVVATMHDEEACQPWMNQLVAIVERVSRERES